MFQVVISVISAKGSDSIDILIVIATDKSKSGEVEQSLNFYEPDFCYYGSDYTLKILSALLKICNKNCY